MLLAIDIGNSDLTLGLWENTTLKKIWRIPSKPEQSELFYGEKIRDQFLEEGLSSVQLSTVVLSSVVPMLTGKIKNTVLIPINEHSKTLRINSSGSEIKGDVLTCEYPHINGTTFIKIILLSG